MPHDPDHIISQFGQTLAHSAESGRGLVQDFTAFAKDESLRFVHLRLERSGAALDRLHHCQGIAGLMGVQQDWLRDLWQDYAGQSLRLMGAWRSLARTVMETAVENVAETVDQTQHQAADAMAQMEPHIAQDADVYAQQTQH